VPTETFTTEYREGGTMIMYRAPEFQESIAKDLLMRVLTTKCDGAGNLPFTAEEQRWAIRVCMDRPEWARHTLESCGLYLSGN